MLGGQQKGWQKSKGLLTSGAEEATYLALLFLGSSNSGLTWTSAMPMNFAATPGASDEDICFVCILYRCS